MNLRVALRFVLVGLANSAVGLLVVVVLSGDRFGWSPYSANAAGYAAGLAFGFALNRGWTFGDRRQVAITAPRYVLAFGLSYGINLAVLATGLRTLALPTTVAQAFALTSYSLAFFLLCRYFVFAEDRHL